MPKADICRAQLATVVYLAHGKDMVVRAHQLVTIRYINQLVYLSGIDQMVTAHDGFVLRDRRWHIVEVIHLNQTAALDVV